jgi:hypothetical protein
MVQPVVPPECAKILFRTSFITLGAFIVAATLQVFDGMVVTITVFMCSINHWRLPVYGLRRNVDILNTVSCLMYQTWRCFAVESPYCFGFLISTYTGIVCFLTGIHLDKTNVMHGTYAHVFVHIMGNVGNIILYVGISRLSGSVPNKKPHDTVCYLV